MILNKDTHLYIDRELQLRSALHTIHFYVYLNHYKEGIGSGLYILYKGKNYLLSAGHVFRKLYQQLEKVYIDFINCPLASLDKGIIAFPSDNQDIPTEIDYALFELNDDIRKKLEDCGMRAYNLEDCSLMIKRLDSSNSENKFLFSFPPE